MNKTTANHIKTFEYIYITFFHGAGKHLHFHTVSITFIPGKILSEKGVEVTVHCRT
jgi:hypothetical protein